MIIWYFVHFVTCVQFLQYMGLDESGELLEHFLIYTFYNI
uniref:Uncharacterized protein n=1 Tax=Anguilla anguilla TaxID=7936 RepID=A0A0E9QC97_ANGAN